MRKTTHFESNIFEISCKTSCELFISVEILKFYLTGSKKKTRGLSFNICNYTLNEIYVEDFLQEIKPCVMSLFEAKKTKIS